MNRSPPGDSWNPPELTGADSMFEPNPSTPGAIGQMVRANPDLIGEHHLFALGEGLSVQGRADLLGPLLLGSYRR